MKALIAIHGWKGNRSSMKPIAKAFNIEKSQWTFLEAPYTVSKNQFSWFDGNDEVGWKYQESFDLLSDTIVKLNENGFSNSNIFLLGFSQGACLIMEYMIRQQFSLGGIIPIAGFIGQKEQFKSNIKPGSRNTSVLLIHGEKDEVVLPEESRIASELFSEAGFKTELLSPSVGHKIPIQIKGIIEDFISEAQH